MVGRVNAGLPLYAQQEWEGCLVLDSALYRGQHLFGDDAERWALAQLVQLSISHASPQASGLEMSCFGRSIDMLAGL